MNINNEIIIAGYGGGKDGGSRTPIEAAEGILTGGNNNTGLVLSKTQIKILDLLSEGEIQGLVSGEYTYSGQVGNIGWSGVTFTPYITATGSSGIKWLQSIFWNDTPVVSKNGQFNFQQTAVNYAKGGPNGTDISDGILDELTTTRVISERLRGGGENFSKIYRIIDKNCIGANVNVRINQLSKTSIDSSTLGDILIDEIDYTIYYRPVFTTQTSGNFILGKKEKIKGKINAGYIRSTRIDFNTQYSNQDNFLGWEIKITRWTEDSTTSSVRNQSFVDSLSEIYGAKFIYPNSAIVSSLFDAEFFSNAPARTYHTQLLKVKVPNNYDPIYKTYDESSPWDGTFKVDGNSRILKQWTDNPVWCYYDILTNKRYGLGSYIDEDYIDKFTLYEISKYCDTIVSDGYGGLEPRFTCNLYINSQEEAYKVVNSMASIFRGITYYSAGQIYTATDIEKQPIYQFTNANVIDGDFNYSSSAKKARHTVAIVRYNDKKDNYKPAMEYVENIDAIRKYGIRDVEVPAFGCTSRGQAIRLGRWALLTENLETESINFRAGIEVAGPLKPGDIFQIYNSNRNNQRLGGRLYNIVSTPSSTALTLDSEITGLNASTTYKLSLLTPTYYYDSSLVTGLNSSDISGIKRSHLQSLTFDTSNTSTISGRTYISTSQTLDNTNYYVSGNPIWLIEATGNNYIGNISNNEWETYRVLNIKETESNIFEIQGLEYDVSKFNQIESGFSFTDTVTSSNLSFNSPTDLQLSSRLLSEHSKIIDYKFTVTNNANIQSYKVLSKTSPFLTNDEYSGEYIIDNLPNNLYSGSYLPSQNGDYYFRIYSVGNNKLSTSFASNSINISNINPIQDITISSLQLSSGILNSNSSANAWSGNYSSASPTFAWQIGINGENNIPSDISHRITIRKPSTNNIPSSEIYYTLTGYKNSDYIYTFPFADNYNAVSNAASHQHGPFREYDIVVEAMTSGGYSSAGNNFLTNGDSDYSNSNGYDIFYAYNRQPISRPLYTGASTDTFYQTGYATQQWITEDGEIKIFFSYAGQIVEPSGFYGDDIAGATLYYSDLPFTTEEAQQKAPLSPASKVINTKQITSNSNPLIIPVGLFNSNLEYISLSPYDSFDVGSSNFINNYLITGISPANVVSISRRASTSSQNYRAWVEFDVGWRNNSWGLIENWPSKSYNISNLQNTTYIDSQGNTKNAGAIIFSTPMSDSSYAVHFSSYQYSQDGIFLYPRNVDGYLDFLHMISKQNDKILVPSFDKLFGFIATSNFKEQIVGRCFVGIIKTN